MDLVNQNMYSTDRKSIDVSESKVIDDEINTEVTLFSWNNLQEFEEICDFE